MINYPELKRNLEKRGYKASVFSGKEEAANYLQEKIVNRNLAFGGSMTLQQLGLYEKLKEKNAVLWHWQQTTAVLPLAQQADVYLSSVNGLSYNGEWVNIDGTGNRVAALIYGPKEVYLVVGRNKIAPDLDAALDRAKNIAAPLNAKRLNADTPCAVKGDRCYDCDSPGRICRVTAIFDYKPNGIEHYEFVIIDEDLGY